MRRQSETVAVHVAELKRFQMSTIQLNVPVDMLWDGLVCDVNNERIQR